MAVMPGDKYVYTHTEGKGYGEHHKGEPLTAEMQELDLKDGTEVSFLEYDADSGWPIVQWVDGVGIDRITTIDPDIFDTNFIPRLGDWYDTSISRPAIPVRGKAGPRCGIPQGSEPCGSGDLSSHQHISPVRCSPIDRTDNGGGDHQ